MEKTISLTETFVLNMVIDGMISLAKKLQNKQEFIKDLETMYKDKAIDNKKIVELCDRVDKLEAKNIGSISTEHNEDYSVIKVYFYQDDTTVLLKEKE